jgi:hypothetical protein
LSQRNVVVTPWKHHVMPFEEYSELLVDIDVCFSTSDCVHTVRDFDFNHVLTKRSEIGCLLVNVVLIEEATVTDPVIVVEVLHAFSMNGSFSAT